MNECEDDDCNGYAWYAQQLLEQRRWEEEEQKRDPGRAVWAKKIDDESLSYRTAQESERETTDGKK